MFNFHSHVLPALQFVQNIILLNKYMLRLPMENLRTCVDMLLAVSTSVADAITADKKVQELNDF